MSLNNKVFYLLSIIKISLNKNINTISVQVFIISSSSSKQQLDLIKNYFNNAASR